MKDISKGKKVGGLFFVCSLLGLSFMYGDKITFLNRFHHSAMYGSNISSSTGGEFARSMLAKYPFWIKEDSLSDFVKNGFKCQQLSVNMTRSNREHPTISSPNETINGNPDNVTRFLVPNVVHYVWLGEDLSFTFISYLSFLSVNRYIKPSYIFVHGGWIPHGHWWNRTIEDVRNIVHVFHELNMTSPSGERFKHMAHVSDELRTRIIYKFGGIYLDSDVLVLKSFDPLRQYKTVLGRESSFGLCNGIIISTRGTPFIQMLLEQYDSYSGQDEIWAFRSVLVPHDLYKVFKSYLHVEEESLHRPNWMELDQIYDKAIDWNKKYAMHLWVRVQKSRNAKSLPTSVHDIDCMNNTISQIGRHVYYGSQHVVSTTCKK